MARSWLDLVERRKLSDYHVFHRNAQIRNRLFLITGAVAIILLCFTFNAPRVTSSATTYITQSITKSVKSTTTPNAKLPITSEHAGTIQHVLSPADKGNADVCKLLLSAVINHYEPVTLYNFHKTGNKLAKISGGLNYMKKLDPLHDDELLLIIDGFDEWFQLPASIMEARYHNINRRENERILTRTGHAYAQSIVISTQRQCWPGNGADISCYATPESPLPAYIFGPETDNMIDDWNNYARLRPRYMNAGYIMGPVKAMRKLWTRAQEHADQDPNVVGLDQNILARIWGEQNYVRESARFNNEPLVTEEPDYSSLPNNSKNRRGSETKMRKRGLGYPEDKPTQARKAFHPENGTNYEFGIGLDYGSELSLPTVFAEYDADWLTFSNETSLTTAFKAQNVSNPGATHLQEDIAALTFKPLKPLLRTPELKAKKTLQGFAETATWNEVPLFTNMWTGISPAIVHHNAWRDGLKDRRRTTWEKMWFQPHARDLLDAWAAAQEDRYKMHNGRFSSRLSAKIRRFIVREVMGKETEEEVLAMRGLGAKTDNDEEGNWASWSDLCGDEAQEEVFRDKKGPWRGLGAKKEEEEKKNKEGELHIVHNEPVKR